MEKIIVAIDGHAGCGKSSTAKQVAKVLGYTYIDTGAMYRAVTLYMVRNQVNLSDENQVRGALHDLDISFGLSESTLTQQTYLNGENVSSEIRGLEVSNAVSAVSAISAVRKKMVGQQQQMGKERGIVMDGRDIGTVVFPEAEVKIFMTASDEVRASRRMKELLEKSEQVNELEVLENLRKRDKIDSSRTDSPLRKAQDAVTIDTSNITLQQQVDQVLALVNEYQQQQTK